LATRRIASGHGHPAVYACTTVEREMERDEEWYAKMEEDFEEDWPLVRHAIWRLEDQHGIYIADVHPRNFKCR
jgi:hypothetical protein